MTSAVKVERRRVYVAYRKLFSGTNALVRKKKAILKILQTSPTFKPFAGQHLESRTISILKSLLKDHVFELEEAAKREFPELWSKTSPDSKALTTCDLTQLKPTKLQESREEACQSLPQANPYGMCLRLIRETRELASHKYSV